MDSELWLRFAKHGIRYTATKGYFWGLRLHPDSKVSGHLFDTAKDSPVLEKRRLEAEKIRARYSITHSDTETAQYLSKLLSLTTLDFWQDKLNSFRYREKTWKQCADSICIYN